MEAHALTIALGLIAIILLFEFTNGLNDSATLVVTSVITGAMEPRKVRWIIACFELIGALFLGTAVAHTLGRGLLVPRTFPWPTFSRARTRFTCSRCGKFTVTFPMPPTGVTKRPT